VFRSTLTAASGGEPLPSATSRAELSSLPPSAAPRNCRSPSPPACRIYFSDRLYSEEELPPEFKLFLPIQVRADTIYPAPLPSSPAAAVSSPGRSLTRVFPLRSALQKS
jgi:hypothetical protein